MVRGYSTSRIIAYCTWAVIVTALSGYLFFPADTMKTYVEKSFEYLSPGSVCKIGRVELLLPLRLSFNNIQITRGPDENGFLFVMDRLELSPVLMKFWKRARVEGELYSGEFTAEFRHNSQGKNFELADIKVQNVDVAEIRKTIGFVEREVTGTIGFFGYYEAKYALPFDGVGQGNVQLTLGSLELMQPVLSLAKLNFEKVVSAVRCEEATCAFSDGEMLGNEIDVTFTGALNFNSPLKLSSLQLNGYLVPQENFFNTHPDGNKLVQQLLYINKTDMLPFTVGGTLNWPTFRLSI